MSDISRRDFAKTAAGAVAAGLMLSTGIELNANQLGLPIG